MKIDRLINVALADKTFKNQIKLVLEDVANDVKEEIDKALEAYYEEYDPKARAKRLKHKLYYERTYQLKDSCKIGDVYMSGNTMCIDVYLDLDSLHYKEASPEDVLASANVGLHGGWDFKAEQFVDWDKISIDSEEAIGSGTQVWAEPMGVLTNGGLEESFIRHAQSRGLNIKKL